MLALVVVLPTPPLPEVTTMISAKCWSSVLLWVPTSWASVELFDQSSCSMRSASPSSQTCTGLPCRSFGMSSSTYEPSERAQIARGHNTEGKPNPASKPRGSDVARYGSAGGLLTTARDYARFLIELLAPKPTDDFRLNTARRSEMFKPHIKLPPDQLIDGATSWALGWAVQEREDRNILVHSGGQSGFRSLAMASPEKRSGFIVLTNSDNGGKLIYHPQMLDLLDRVLVSAD